MQYCVNFYKHIKKLDIADEFTITYSNRNDVLIDFLEEFKDKRVNLTIEKQLTDSELKLLKTISDSYPNLFLRFEFYNYDYTENICESGVPYFFARHVNNWDEFLGLIDLGVSDIYVVEDLGFELESVAKVAHENNVRIRIYPNVAQSQWKDTPDFKKFWIRPEDIHLYDGIVDVCEFFGEPKHMPTLLKIYKEDKKWLGALKDLIIGLHTTIDNRLINFEFFGEGRINCGKKCLKGNACRRCDRVVELAKTLEKVNLTIEERKGE